MREKPLNPWIIAEKDGKILAGHCDCMAGLGEVCTHVAALLFTVEAAVKLRNSKTVTEDKAYWLLPSVVKNIEFKECRKIDFTSASTLKKKFDKNIECVMAGNTEETSKKPAQAMFPKVPQPTANEVDTLLRSLSDTGAKSGILSIVAPYSDDFVPAPMAQVYPTILSELRNESAFPLNYIELVSFCKTIEISVTAEQALAVEKATRDQANSKMWFRFRAGRITASKMKAVCHTDPTQPALSLIKSICYPESYNFTSKYTSWGCQHEKYACQIFLERMSTSHENFQIKYVGFFINPDVPFIGASPDGIASCKCCGVSTLEVKCPFCKRHDSLDTGDKKFYLKRNEDGSLVLDKTHAYFYQVQTQLGVCKLESGYFVVWTENDLHYEQIIFDYNLWSEICEKSRQLFAGHIMPELVGRFYSKKTVAYSPQTKSWCYCNENKDGKMVCCENPKCSIQWFHFSCLGMRCNPKGKWYCPDCHKLHGNKRKRLKIK